MNDMEKCLVKKLGASVNDLNLDKLGYLRIFFMSGELASGYSYPYFGDTIAGKTIHFYDMNGISVGECVMEDGFLIPNLLPAGVDSIDGYIEVPLYDISGLAISAFHYSKVNFDRLRYNSAKPTWVNVHNAYGDIALFSNGEEIRVDCQTYPIADNPNVAYGKLSVFADNTTLTSLILLNCNIEGNIEALGRATGLTTLYITSLKGIVGDSTALLDLMVGNGRTSGQFTINCDATSLNNVTYNGQKITSLTAVFSSSGYIVTNVVYA